MTLKELRTLIRHVILEANDIGIRRAQNALAAFQKSRTLPHVKTRDELERLISPLRELPDWSEKYMPIYRKMYGVWITREDSSDESSTSGSQETSSNIDSLIESQRKRAVRFYNLAYRDKDRKTDNFLEVASWAAEDIRQGASSDLFTRIRAQLLSDYDDMIETATQFEKEWRGMLQTQQGSAAATHRMQREALRWVTTRDRLERFKRWVAKNAAALT